MNSDVTWLSPTQVRLRIDETPDPPADEAVRPVAFRFGQPEMVVTDEVRHRISTQIAVAVRDHAIKVLGHPQVDTVQVDDGRLRLAVSVEVRPEIARRDPASVVVDVAPVEVSDHEVDEEVEQQRLRLATFTVRESAARPGDFVTMDLVASVDGEVVERGTATDVAHEVGSGHRLAGLDDALVGLSAGESVTITTRLVGGRLAGNEAALRVTVTSVHERHLPDVDDSFAIQAAGLGGLDELREHLRARLLLSKRAERLFMIQSMALDELVDRAAVPLPEGLVRENARAHKESLLEQLRVMGGSLEDYLASEGISETEADGLFVTMAAERTRRQLVLDAIAEAEQIGVTEDEARHWVVRRARQMRMDTNVYLDRMRQDDAVMEFVGEVRRRKALAFVMDRITYRDPDGNPMTLEELGA